MKKQTIYVLGYPKSGTTWLSRLLGDTLNSPVGGLLPKIDSKAIATEGKSRTGRYNICQGHPVPVPDYPSPVIPAHPRIAYRNLTNEKVVIMVRDPRDIAISAQHHWGMETLEQAVRCMVFAEWPIPHGGGWVNWVKVWRQLPDVVTCWTSYESLLQSPEAELCRILDKLHVKGILPVMLESVIERQSFKARRQWTQTHGDDLNYGKEFQLRFLRKGIVGDWVNHDWSNCYDLAMEHWTPTMEILGYDTSGPN